MSDLHPNVLTYLAAMGAFNRDDLSAVAENVHPDFVYRIPGHSNIAGEFHGVEGFVEALTRLRDESDGTIELTWTDNSAVEDEYQVSYGLGGCQDSFDEWVMASLPANSTSVRTWSFYGGVCTHDYFVVTPLRMGIYADQAFVEAP